MTVEAPAGTLRERALAAKEARDAEVLAQAEDEAAHEREQDTARLAEALQRAEPWLGLAPKPTGPQLEWRGLTFSALRYFVSGTYKSVLALRGDCPKCGLRTYSEQLTSLADLGAQIADFTPNIGHVCRKPAAPPEPEPTTAERLVDLIREIVREELP